MRCIICMKEKSDDEFNEEHVFPLAIGGNLIIKNVCTDCNSILGTEVDCNLTENFLIKLARYTYKIPDRSGNIIDPFRREKRIDKQPFNATVNPKTGIMKPYRITKKIENKILDNGNRQLSLTVDKTDQDKVIEIVKKYCKRNNIPPPNDEQLEKMLNNSKVESYRPTFEYGLEFDVSKYKIAILKIVYELACYWLKEPYLSDNIAAELRKIIQSKNIENSKINGIIDVHANILSKIPHDKQCHSAFIILDERENTLSIVIRIFDIFDGVVVISRNAKRYHNITNKNIPYIKIDPCSHVKIENNFLNVLHNL